MVLPPSLEEMIDVNHPVRVVNRFIEQIEIDPVIDKYKGGGTSSYHPRMLLKVVVFEEVYGKMPEEATADAGYRSDENYTFLGENKITA